MNFALLFLIVSLIFAGAVAYYFSVVRREVREEHKLEIEEKKMHEEEITKDEARVKEELADAHRRATAILAQSEKIAHDLIFELEQVLGKKGIDTTLAIQPATDFEIELGTLSEKIKVQYVSRIKGLLESLDKFQVDQAQKLQAFAEEQQVTTDKNLQQMRINELDRVQQRITKYKEEELALFNRKVKDIIESAAQEVLGQALSSHEQEMLISKALDKARQEGVI
jgi:hypothetical protein